MLLPTFIKSLNEGSLSLRELVTITQNLYILRLQSPKLYEIIVDYFIRRKSFTEADLQSLGFRSAVNFLHALLYCHGELKHEEFFGLMRRYITSNIDEFNKFQLIKLLDIYKYNVHF